MAKSKCEICKLHKMSGVLNGPRMKHGATLTEECVIERCDSCSRYGSDAEAAIHFTTRFGGRLRYDQRVIVWTPEKAVIGSMQYVEGSCSCLLNILNTQCPTHGPLLRAALDELTAMQKEAR